MGQMSCCWLLGMLLLAVQGSKIFSYQCCNVLCRKYLTAIKIWLSYCISFILDRTHPAVQNYLINKLNCCARIFGHTFKYFEMQKFAIIFLSPWKNFLHFIFSALPPLFISHSASNTFWEPLRLQCEEAGEWEVSGQGWRRQSCGQKEELGETRESGSCYWRCGWMSSCSVLIQVSNWRERIWWGVIMQT